MGISESQKRNNKKLFKEVFSDAVHEIQRGIDSKIESKLYISWCKGAIALAESLVEMPLIEEACNMCDKERTKRVFEVCLYPMISINSREMNEQTGDISIADKKHHLKTYVTKMLNLIGNTSEQKIKDFFNLDIQYNYDADSSLKYKESGSEHFIGFLNYASLFLSKIGEVFGYGECINWKRSKFPIKEYEVICLDLLNEGSNLQTLNYKTLFRMEVITIIFRCSSVMFENLAAEP